LTYKPALIKYPHKTTHTQSRYFTMAKQFSRLMLIAGILTTSMNAQYVTRFDGKNQLLNKIDNEALLETKNELMLLQNVLVQIRDSQQAGIISKTGSIIDFASKEFVILFVSAITGACATLLIYGTQQLDYLNVRESFGIPLTKIEKKKIATEIIGKIVPIFILSTVGSDLLIHIASKIFSGNNHDTHNIKESLDTLNQLISNIDYELKKIDRISKNLSENPSRP